MDVIKERVSMQGNVKAKRTPAGRGANGRGHKQVRTVAQDVHEIADIARDGAQAKLELLRETASDYQEAARDRVQEVEHTIEQYIRERPLKTVLIAAGVGLLLGRFWLRR